MLVLWKWKHAGEGGARGPGRGLPLPVLDAHLHSDMWASCKLCVALRRSLVAFGTVKGLSDAASAWLLSVLHTSSLFFFKAVLGAAHCLASSWMSLCERLLYAGGVKSSKAVSMSVADVRAVAGA